MITRTLANGRTVKARRNDGLRKRCDCGRTKWLRCAHPWHANASVNGTEHRVSLHKWAKKKTGYVMLKTEAETLYSKWVATLDDPTPTRIAGPALPFSTVATRYVSEYVTHPDRRESAQLEMARQVRVLERTFGTMPMKAITKADVERFRLERRRTAEEQPLAMRTKQGRVSTNRLLARLRHLFVWGIEQGLIDSTPFLLNGVTVIKLDAKAESNRTRRLEDGEESRLLVAAGSHLRACIEATLDTGMRRGEILGLRWQDVQLSTRTIFLPATLTKTGTPRTVIFSSRLAAVLEMRRYAPDGRELPAEAFVFGDDCGGKVKSIKTAWKLTCRRAGIVGLHFHDLRREAGSRMLDAGNSLTDVRDFLGHTDVSQTNTYLATTAARLRAALEKRDDARTHLAQMATPPVTAALTH